VEESKNVGIFNCLKEWSYLSPKWFNPDEEVLKKYGLKPYSYVFVREVSNKSFNYYDQEDAIICSISSQISEKLPVVLSLEDKSIQSKFPVNWIQLEEPVDDIHSLIYYSKLVISSGDSMAREGAMLGVPSIYCGIREMKANKLLIDKGSLLHLPGKSALTKINNLIIDTFNPDYQLEFRKQLLTQWDDMQEFMKVKINQFKK